MAHSKLPAIFLMYYYIPSQLFCHPAQATFVLSLPGWLQPPLVSVLSQRFNASL